MQEWPVLLYAQGRLTIK